MKLVYRVEKDAEAFREKWLLDETDENTNDWLEYLNMIRGKGEGFKNTKELEKNLDKIKSDKEYMGSRVLTIVQLGKVCERQKLFEEFYDTLTQRVEDALYHYMAKYCHSFFAELEDMDVACVRDYENNINDWQAEIKACLMEAEASMSDLMDMCETSLVEYIGSYGQVLMCMHSVLDAFLGVCDPFRSWVTADEGYVKKIRIELDCLQRQRARMMENIRKNTYRIEEAKAKEIRTNFANKKLNQAVEGRIKDRRFCRKREFSFIDKIEFTENILHEKKMELDEAMGKLQHRPLHTLVREPSDGMTDRSAKLQKEVSRLERKVEAMKKAKRDMRGTRYELQKDYHNLKGTYESSLKKAARESEQFREHIGYVKKQESDQRLLDRKIKALKRIIEVKTHPATVKKIFFNGYTAGEKMDFRGISTLSVDPPDTLREAIDVAAAGVGKDWGKMYQCLPFNPPRNPFLRSHDLEAMDMDFRCVHPPSEQMALRSLDKWTSLSKVTSVNALVRTLKTIKKTDVAKKIEKQILTVVN